MRSFDDTTKALALVVFAALAAGSGCVAQADDGDDATADPPGAVGEAIAAWFEQAPGSAPGAPPGVPLGQSCTCTCTGGFPQNAPTQAPTQAPFEVAPQPPPQLPPPQLPPPPPQLPSPPPQGGELPPGGVGCAPGGVGCATGGGVGCVPAVGCATSCCGFGFTSLPGGYHTVVWPVTGQFFAFPGLRNGFGGCCGC